MRTLFISLMILLLLTACGAPIQQTSETPTSGEASEVYTPLPETTITSQPTADPTATITPIASATLAAEVVVDLSRIEGVVDLGDAWQIVDPVSKQLITVGKDSVKVEGEWAIMGLWNVNIATGEVRVVTGSVPDVKGLSALVEILPVVELDMSDGSWQQTLTDRFESAVTTIDQTQVWKKFALEYKGELVVPRPNSLKVNIYPDSGIANVIATVTLNKVDSNGVVGEVVWDGDSYGQRVNSSTPLTFPMRVLDQGWFVINTSDDGGESRVMAMPVAIMGKNGVPVVKYALTDDKAWDTKIIESLSSDSGFVVQPLVVVGANTGGDWQQAVTDARASNESDPRMKIMADNALAIAAQMNQKFFRTHRNSGFIEMGDLEGVVLVARAVEPLDGPYMQVDVRLYEYGN